MASSALCCLVCQVLGHVYPGSSKAFSEPRVTVPSGRRGAGGRRCAGSASVQRGPGNRIGQGDGCPRWGREAAAPPGFPWLPLSPSASSSSRRGVIGAGCGSGCSIALAPPPRAAGWCCAARRCGGRGSCRWPVVRGRCGGCERPGTNRGACGARPSSQTAQQPKQPTARAKPNSPRAKGPRAQGPRREPGGRQQTRNPTLTLRLAGGAQLRQAERQ